MVISYVGGSISIFFSAATSIITARVINAPTFSTPSFENPERVEISSSLKQLYMLLPIIW